MVHFPKSTFSGKENEQSLDHTCKWNSFNVQDESSLCWGYRKWRDRCISAALKEVVQQDTQVLMQTVAWFYILGVSSALGSTVNFLHFAYLPISSSVALGLYQKWPHPRTVLSVSTQAQWGHSTELFYHHHHHHPCCCHRHQKQDLFSASKVPLDPGQWPNYSVNHRSHFPVSQPCCSHTVKSHFRRKYSH